MEVLYWIAALTAIFVLPVSLGVEGADWGPMFRGFGAPQWGALLFSACVGHVGAGPLLQVGGLASLSPRRGGFSFLHPKRRVPCRC